MATAKWAYESYLGTPEGLQALEAAQKDPDFKKKLLAARQSQAKKGLGLIGPNWNDPINEQSAQRAAYIGWIEAKNANAKESAAEQALGYHAGQEAAVQGLAGAASGLQQVGQNMWDQYQATFAPKLTELAANVNVPEERYVGQAATDVNTAYDSAEGQARRGLERMGVDPSSGAWAGEQGDLTRARAASLAGGMTRARAQGRDENFQRLSSFAGLGMNSANQATATLGSAMTGQGQVATQLGGMAEEWAGLATDQAVSPVERTLAAKKATGQYKQQQYTKLPTRWQVSGLSGAFAA